MNPVPGTAASRPDEAVASPEPATSDRAAASAGQPDAAGPSPSEQARVRSAASLLGVLVSLVAVAGVVWWALGQEPPTLPSSSSELLALAGAIGLYAIATVVRAERWERLLAQAGSPAPRADVYALTVVGYAVNNVLPARAGDAARVLLLAPRVRGGRRTILGTLLAERLLDVAVVIALFLLVGYALLDEVGGGSLEVVGLAAAAAMALGVVAILLVRRSRRLHTLLEPVLASTLALRGRHGALLLAMTVLVWVIETGVWMSIGASVGFGMDPMEGAYLVALASVFALIPSGPGYAGTQDAAAIIGIKAIGGTGAIALSYLVMLRFVLVVPITLLGFVFLASRYGGIARLRAARGDARRPCAPRGVARGARPFHHDESQDAYFSWVLQTRGEYAYNPLLHGPLRFYLTAAIYEILGATDASARLAPALMGTAMVALPVGLRAQLGRGGALVAAALLAFGPSFLYFSRFAREDIYIACITLAGLVVLLRYLDAPRRHHPVLLGALLALSFATKESTFITVFVLGTFLGALALWQVRRHGWRSAPLLRDAASLGWKPWAWGVLAFWGVFALLFTVFGTRPDGLWAGIHDGLAYWLGQQPVGRGGEPTGFYVFLLLGEEWPVLGLAAVGVAAIVRSGSVGRWLLVWTFALSLAVYSWASEKFAWLLLHPLLPLIALAGIGAQALWAARDRRLGRAGLLAAVLGAVYLAYASFTVNAVNAADPRELLVSTQSSRDVLGIRDRVRRVVREADGPVSVAVDSAEGAAFPWAWYLRDLPVSYADLTRGQPGPAQAQVLILTESSRARMLPELAAYEGRRFFLREWWVKDYRAGLAPANWLRWMVGRTPWNATGGMTEWLYVRRDVA